MLHLILRYPGVGPQSPWTAPDAAPLPRNWEAEQALLGAILANNEVYFRCADFLRPEHFDDALHGRIYEAIGRLLYSRYLYVFEGAGLVLLVAMIGAIVLTHRARGGVKGQNINRQVSRRPQDATRNMQPPVGQGVEL